MEEKKTTLEKTNPAWINAGNRVDAFNLAFNDDRAITDVTGIPINNADPTFANPCPINS